MNKSLKNKKNKVPKITEEEYLAYVAALKTSEEPIEKIAETPPVKTCSNQQIVN